MRIRRILPSFTVDNLRAQLAASGRRGFCTGFSFFGYGLGFVFFQK